MEQQPGHREFRPPLIFVHIVAVALAFLNLVLWYVWRPTEDDLTSAALTGLSVLKVLVLAAVLWQFRGVHVLIGRGAVSPKRAMGGWTLGLVAVLAILMPLRETTAQTFETVCTHLVKPSEEIGYNYPWLTSPSEETLRHRHFAVQWKRGEILGIEALLAAIIVFAHVAVARRLGRAAGIRSVLVAGVFSFVACGLFGRIFGLVLWTYDTFYLGTMAGPLAFDFVTPMVLYPTTPLAAPFYVALSLSSWAIAAGRRAPAPERSEPNDPMVAAHANG